MGLATHLGPWLLGTVKDTTGSTAGTIRNIGATLVAQTKVTAYTDSAAAVCTVPAGSLVLSVTLLQTTKYTSGSAGTVTVLLNGTAMAVATITGAGASGMVAVVPTTDAQTLAMSNVGTTDGVLTVTGATLTAGAGVLVVDYIVRNADGSTAPTSYTV